MVTYTECGSRQRRLEWCLEFKCDACSRGNSAARHGGTRCGTWSCLPPIAFISRQLRPDEQQLILSPYLLSLAPASVMTRGDDEEPVQQDERTALLGPKSVSRTRQAALRRELSGRQVSMIAIAGTIGTGLFLGTGRSLATGGPASILICYSLVGGIVYITLLLLGEIATQYPVAGSFNAYATRFVDDSYGFALSWNYWFNDAVSVASDLTAAQLVVRYWTDWHPWVVPLVFFIFLVTVNGFRVGAYGELEYWLSSLKIVTIVVFILVGTLVNVGVNADHHFIGFENWRIPGAPFVGGFTGFATVFVTASFAYGGTESLGITAGETSNPSKALPRVVKMVFFRIMLFYVVSIFIIGLNVPWDYPHLSDKSITTSPFTLVFQRAGSRGAASTMNAVILSSVLSAGNHALFAGTRVLYSLSVARQAPAIFRTTTSNGVPLSALLATSSISVLCLGTSYVGAGEIWAWLQNIVGVSNQIAWLSIGLASWRFRHAWTLQGRSLDELKFQGARWTWGWGPPFVVFSVSSLIIIQGWSSIVPVFSPLSFVSFYIELPIMLLFYVAWKLRWRRPIVDLASIDLHVDEHEESAEDVLHDATREARISGKWRHAWQAYYLIA
ncbi:amino acid permease-domain-containing protein [Auriculariales sp. MPI-PUGE-AT-0066]|nr:amino acid permease-domain-containing protein [Auriculariales sp. MPI-PUGE-AT-0066]